MLSRLRHELFDRTEHHSPAGARAVGGDAAVFEQQLPLLKSFSGEVIHLGEIGFGSTAKLINNMLAFCNSAAAAEALMIGKRSGIDLTKLDAVIRNASGMSAGYANMASKTPV